MENDAFTSKKNTWKSSLIIAFEVVVVVILLGAIYYTVTGGFAQQAGTDPAAEEGVVDTTAPQDIDTGMVATTEPASGAGDGVSEEEIMNYLDEAEMRMVESDTITITSECQANPSDIVIPYGSEFTIENSGDVDIELTFGGEHTFTALAGDTSVVVADFEMGEGVYGFTCSIEGSMMEGEVGFMIGTVVLR